MGFGAGIGTSGLPATIAGVDRLSRLERRPEKRPSRSGQAGCRAIAGGEAIPGTKFRPMTCLMETSNPSAAGSPRPKPLASVLSLRSTSRRRPDVEERGKRDSPRDPFGGSMSDDATATQARGASLANPASEGAGRRSPSRSVEIRLGGGCHRGVIRLYPPLARKRDRDRRAEASRLLLSSAGFASFRAPIDSVMDPGGQPRRPSDPFLSLRCGFGPLKG